MYDLAIHEGWPHGADHHATGRTRFVQAFFNPEKDKTYPEHQKTTRDHYLKSIETHLNLGHSATQGEYVVGKTFTYADMVVYQILHDENLTQDGRAGLQNYTRLAKLVDALEARPNIKAFLQSKRYRG